MLRLLPDDPKAAADIVALENALRRSQEERDQWRGAYLRLASKVTKLGLMRAAVIELSSEQPS